MPANCDHRSMDTNDERSQPNDDVQSEPVEAGHDDATRAEQLEGVIDQVRGDLLLGHVDDARGMVRDRLADAGLGADESDVDAVLSAVQDGTPA